MFLQKEQALQFLNDFNLMCFLWSLKNTMAILVSKKEKKKSLFFCSHRKFRPNSAQIVSDDRQTGKMLFQQGLFF